MIFDGSTYVFPKTANNNYHDPEDRVAFITDRNARLCKDGLVLRAHYEVLQEYPSTTALSEILGARIDIKAATIVKIFRSCGIEDQMQPSNKYEKNYISAFVVPTDVNRFHTQAWL